MHRHLVDVTNGILESCVKGPGCVSAVQRENCSPCSWCAVRDVDRLGSHVVVTSTCCGTGNEKQREVTWRAEVAGSWVKMRAQHGQESAFSVRGFRAQVNTGFSSGTNRHLSTCGQSNTTWRGAVERLTHLRDSKFAFPVLIERGFVTN